MKSHIIFVLNLNAEYSNGKKHFSLISCDWSFWPTASQSDNCL